MDRITELFLETLGAALRNERVEWNSEIDPEIWKGVFKLAAEHNVLPMVFTACYKSEAAQKLDPDFIAAMKKRILRLVALQSVKINEFLKLLPVLYEAGITPLVVKGIICRNVYPNPNLRLSGDEDILIPPEQFEKLHEIMLEQGMQLKEPEKDISEEYEVPYIKKDSPLYIEAHKYLFPPENEAYGSLNRFFENAVDMLIYENINGVEIATLNYTQHLFYLICHSFKHFLHSGIGIRQLCDISLFANAYGNLIDWDAILENCREINADVFAAAVFEIGRKHLAFDPQKACWTEEWRRIEADETDLLNDILSGGTFGTKTLSRTHSSNITLNAVADFSRGEAVKNSVIKTVFPPVNKMTGRYPYLKEHPYLLPAAWIDRIVKYGIETSAGKKENKASESIRIGNERIELLKKYGIIK